MIFICQPKRCPATLTVPPITMQMFSICTSLVSAHCPFTPSKAELPWKFLGVWTVLSNKSLALQDQKCTALGIQWEMKPHDFKSEIMLG